MASKYAREKTKYVGVYTRKDRKSDDPRDVVYDITYKNAEGKKVWICVGRSCDGFTATYANQMRLDHLNDIRMGEKPRLEQQKTLDCLTFGEAWQIFEEKWLPNLANPKDERNRYHWYLEEPLANRRLDSIKLLDLENIKQEMLGKGLSASTVRLALGDVRRIYRKMVLWDLYSGLIPTTGLKMPKLDNARTRFLSKDEASSLLEDLKERSAAWYGIAWLSLHTGMRKGEILHLKGEHVDFAGKQILIMDAKTGTRKVPLTDAVAAFLRERMPSKRTAYVFPAANGGPMRLDSDQTFERAVNACGLNNGITDKRHRVVFHTLRHTFCSWLAMDGVPIYVIGELVGHKTPDMTSRYSHLCPGRGRSAAAKISAFLGGA